MFQVTLLYPLNNNLNIFVFLRDDIVFFIFLYQRYVYKEDKSRVNEFGFSAEMLNGGIKDNNIVEVDAENSPLAITEEMPAESSPVKRKNPRKPRKLTRISA